MKRILFLAGIVVVGTALVCGAAFAYLNWFAGESGSASRAEVCPPPRKLKPLPDADVLAARMKHDQDIYQKVRDDALAAYAKQSPVARPSDDEARAALRLAAYLVVWDDFYGECLWPQLSDHADNLLREGNHDSSWQVFYDDNLFAGSYSTTEAGAQKITREMIDYGATEYPPLFKLAGYRAAMNNLISVKAHPKLHISLAALPDLAARVAAEYQHLIEAHFPDRFLYFQGSNLLKAVQDDDDTLKAVSEGMDRAFTAADRDNPTADILDGEFYVDEAWCARGGGYADTVTSSGWQLFGERLDAAEKILTQSYAKAPQDTPMIASAMMTVVLGKQEPRDQMELWFQRGIQADPDNFGIYMQKRWYLLPRWYGSDEDVAAFGLECATSDNWSAKIPLVLAESMSDAGGRDPLVYAQPAIWGSLEKVYRGYLERLPNSFHYRSLFAKNAVQGEHWDVAKEQFKILGDDWDRAVFEDNEYAEMSALAKAH